MTDGLRARLRGVTAFPITPFRHDLSLDLPGLRANIKRLIDYRVSAVVAAGGTGEMYSLTPAEHGEVVKAIVEEVGRRVLVICGTGFNRQIAIEVAQQSAKLGADAILALHRITRMPTMKRSPSTMRPSAHPQSFRFSYIATTG